MKKLILLSILIFLFSCVEKQESKYSLGALLLSDSAYNTIDKAPEIYLDAPLPPVKILPCPPVGNQGTEGSCVAWGASYAARSIDWYMIHGNTSYSTGTNIFSPEYVYNQIKKSSCGSGAYTGRALVLFYAQGVCTYASMPSQLGCTLMPNATQKTEAANYKIYRYGTARIDVTTLKTYLASGKPIIVAGPVNSTFMNLPNGAVLQNLAGTVLGDHCYCLVGYDDTKQAFKFMNSWGTGWASQGFGWMSYTYINSWLKESYVMTTTVNP